jgi:hypothetical protein
MNEPNIVSVWINAKLTKGSCLVRAKFRNGLPILGMKIQTPA